MTTLTRRATIYLDPRLYKALQLKSVETERSVSVVVNDAIREALAEDEEDLASFSQRKNETTISFEAFLKELKRNGTL